MAHLTWEVDPTVAIHPDLVTRIRVLNDKQRNIYAFGENICRLKFIANSWK